jgi:tRNA(Ile)-lysidine synthase TilS/MesJ
MVYKYCQSLNIPFYIREVNEIHRTRDGDRKFYEEITRTIRFNAYEKIDGPIILGHNLDDTLENIFSNIKKQKNYDNLFGMSNFSTERNISIWRPLLSIAKKDIILFAHENNIPYTYDSTPAWSDRGKMRDNLIPFINQFDTNILEGLVNMCHNFKEIYKIYETSIPEIEYKDNYCIINNQKEIYFEDYWKKILSIIVEKYGFEYIKNKSVKNMIFRIKIGSKERITLSKNIILQMRNDKKIFIYVLNYA